MRPVCCCLTRRYRPRLFPRASSLAVQGSLATREETELRFLREQRSRLCRLSCLGGSYAELTLDGATGRRQEDRHRPAQGHVSRIRCGSAVHVFRNDFRIQLRMHQRTRVLFDDVVNADIQTWEILLLHIKKGVLRIPEGHTWIVPQLLSKTIYHCIAVGRESLLPIIRPLLIDVGDSSLQRYCRGKEDHRRQFCQARYEAVAVFGGNMFSDFH